MKQYKIVEMKNGHGDLRFQIKMKVGFWLFTYWEERGDNHPSLKDAQTKVEYYIGEEKSEQRIKVKEYLYTKVPNHVPEDQIGKFMELNMEKKKC